MKTHLIYNKISLLILLSFLPFNNEFAYSISKPNKKNISLLITDNKRNYDLTYQQVEFDNKNIENSIQIDINRDIKKQKIDGFGAAITGSSAFNLMQMSPQNRRKFLTETFSIDKGYGFSYLRVPIGCSDFSLSEYTCCDKPGIENFSLQAEEIGRAHV